MTRRIRINDLEIGGSQPFALIAGPCVIETEKIALDTAEAIKKITDNHFARN